VVVAAIICLALVLLAVHVSSGDACPSACRVAVCAPWIRSDGHAPAGVATQAKLTFEADHSMGADHHDMAAIKPLKTA
jgi:hypothetical protein